LSINEIEAWFLTEKILVSLPFFGRTDGQSVDRFFACAHAVLLLSTLIYRRPLDDRPTDAGPRRVQGSRLQKERDVHPKLK
jgi:hypothetical protein